MVKAGGFGKFQILLILCNILANNSAGLIVYGVAYYELEPPYNCTYSVPQYAGHVPDFWPSVPSETRKASFVSTVNAPPSPLYTV